MRQFDAGDVLEGVRVEQCKLAAVRRRVVYVAHQHAIVLGGIRR